MPYIFRLQNENQLLDLSNSLLHWGESQMYGDGQINAIESTNPNTHHQPTSIPSPFARIALVKTAFAEVARYGNNALAAYQKIVSDTLDVAEIFLSFNRFRNLIEIIKWNYGRQDNGELSQDSSLLQLRNTHYQLYKTLKTFLENDADKYNFDKMKAIYLLKYRPTGDIIGATSPCTLFMSSPNNLENVNITLSNNRRAFVGITPLHQRNWYFQKYLYGWIRQYNETRNINGKNISIFEEFVSYLEAQRRTITRNEEIERLANVDINFYREHRGPDVEVLGKPLHYIAQILPEFWTTDDVFENTLIKIPYSMSNSFFNGNLNERSDTFLLPIKDTFFNFYTIEDLRNWLRITRAGTVVEVRINFPNREPLVRRYSVGENTIIERTFDCALFPNVRFNDENLANYRFGLVYAFNERNNFNVEFIKINSNINANQIRNSVRNETHPNNYQLRNYTLEGSNFDYIRISYQHHRGILIPNFQQLEGNSTFTFAIDFGTTNTHIAYRVNNQNNILPFNIQQNDIQIHYLHGGDDILKRYFDEEYIPITTNEEFKFPMRTALSYGENTQWMNVYPFEKASLNELYEKRMDYPYNQTETNLKWSDEANYQNKIKAYIESLMYLLRNKVVLNHGNLRNTKIIWFYPVSMERRRYEALKSIWQQAYRKYFGGDENNIITITESIAPFEYYIKDGDASNIITIDIGGGTTDVVIAENRNALYITSFRFATNAIFGDAYAENNRIRNVIVSQFADIIRERLSQTIINPNDEIFEVFNEISNRNSEDIASFLFSLKTNTRVLAYGGNLAYNVDFHRMLIEDNTYKITFIFFYSSIIYHIAKLLQALNLRPPQKIVFSGNGSRVVHFISSDINVLTNYTKRILKNIYNQDINLQLVINREQPKEATCLGGFYLTQPYDYETILNKKVILHSNNNAIIRFTQPNENNDTYQAINEQYLENTVTEVQNFIEFVFNNLDFFARCGYQLNQEIIDVARNVMNNREQLLNYVKIGWEQKQREIDLNEVINETLFFYPIIGMLKELSNAIWQHIQNNVQN